MGSPIVYVVLTGFMFIIGLDILIQRKGGVYHRNGRIRTIKYYTGKPALIMGTVITGFSLIFLTDAVITLLDGSRVNTQMTCMFCSGSFLIIFFIAVFIRQFANSDG
jgi:hypothetical protein